MAAKRLGMGEADHIAEVPRQTLQLTVVQWRWLKAATSSVLWLSALLFVWGAFKEPGARTLVLISGPLGLWLLLAVHEAGHAVATWMVGWRVLAIAIGPLGYHFHNRNLAFVPRSKRIEFQGFVMPMPMQLETWTLVRKNIISAGGPIANVMLAAGLFFAWVVTPVPGPEETVDLPMLFIGLAIGSLSLGLESLMPSLRDKSTSDGDDIRTALRTSSAEWMNDRALAYLAGSLHCQLRLRDLPLWILEDFAKAADRVGGDHRKAYEQMLIGIILDSPPVQLAQTRAMLNDFRHRHGRSEWLDSCDAYFEAIWVRDATAARSLLWRGEATSEMEAMRLAAEAAVLAREGNVAEARHRLGEMRAANRKKSIFPDHTFRDIGRQIEAILPA